MSKKNPTPPPAPDPTVVSKAQADANIASATAQQRLNQVGTRGPDGSVLWQADDSQPGGYTQVTSLDPAQQAILDAQRRTELGATNIAQDQLGRVQTALQTPLDTSGLPDLRGGAQSGPIQSSFGMGQQLQYGFDPGQQVQGQVGGDLDAARLQQMAATYGQATSRLDPRFDREEGQLRQRLADQGFSQNSQGYKDAQDDLGRTKTDAYNQAIFSSIGAGEDAANSLFGRQVGQGQFANQAAAQQYAQNQGQAAFGNATSGQDYSQNLGAAQFANSAENQRFNQTQASAQMDNQARQQGLQERAYVQNQPINQLTGLLGLGQVSTPQGIQYTPSQVGQTDVTGAYALQSQAQQAAYNAQMQRQGGLMGGLFSLGSAAIMSSDGRLKTDKRLLRVRPDGVEVWAFRYLTDPEGVVRIGVLAQQVKKVRPDLVVKGSDGFLAVNYAGLDAEAA